MHTFTFSEPQMFFIGLCLAAAGLLALLVLCCDKDGKFRAR